jgi:hypothetical protein
MQTGTIVEHVKPWLYHGAPDDDERRHTGTVIDRAQNVPESYITVQWCDGFISSVHPWDIVESIIPF